MKMGEMEMPGGMEGVGDVEKVRKGDQFKFKIENSKIFRSISETLSSIIDEVKLEVNPKEFTIKAMDPSRICMLELQIAKGNFEEFTCKKKVQVGLNLIDFEKIIKRSSGNDTLTISHDDNKIVIQMKGNEKRTKTFKLAEMDIDAEEVPVERLHEMVFESNFTMNCDLLAEAIKDAEIYSEVLNVKASEETGLLFSSTGQIGEMEYELGLEDLLDHHLQDTTTGSYALSFLKSIMKISSITEKLEIFLSEDHLLKMVFNLIEGGILTYFLAPRVNSEDTFDDNEDEIIDDF
jgi:proliferating cell nuclear antigen